MIGTWFDRRFGDVVCAFGATLRFWREVIAVSLAKPRSSAEVQGDAFLAMQGDSVGRGGGNAVVEDAGPSSGIELLSSPAGPTPCDCPSYLVAGQHYADCLAGTGVKPTVADGPPMVFGRDVFLGPFHPGGEIYAPDPDSAVGEWFDAELLRAIYPNVPRPDVNRKSL